MRDDNEYDIPAAPYGRMKMHHMLADTDDELHAMADRIGVARRHWQAPKGMSGSHYDICTSKRTLAIQHGADEINEVIRNAEPDCCCCGVSLEHHGGENHGFLSLRDHVIAEYIEESMGDG